MEKSPPSSPKRPTHGSKPGTFGLLLVGEDYMICHQIYTSLGGLMMHEMR